MKMSEKMELAIAAMFIGFGLFCLLFPRVIADGVMISIAIFCTISAILLLVQFFSHHHPMDLIKGSLTLLLALLFWGYRAEGLVFVAEVCGLYMLFNAIVLFSEGIVDLREHSKAGWYFIVSGFGAFMLFVLSQVFAKDDPRFWQRMIGAYLCYQGLQEVFELFVFRHHHSSRAWSFRYWTALPVYIAAAGPSLILRYAEKKKLTARVFPKGEYKNDQPVNLRVFIHTGLDGDHQVGHMTFSYQGIMFSYGNYDVAEEKFMRTIGPGILFTVPAEVYVNNSCMYEGSTLFEFGIHLDAAQEKRLVSLLKSCFDQSYRWYCPLSRVPLTEENFKKMESDYSCRLFWRTGCKYYKFRKGIWKTYWVLGNNCSLFASSLLHDIDRDFRLPRGINTPGEFFEYFVEAYQDPSSNVVYQSWHSADYPETLYPAAL